MCCGMRGDRGAGDGLLLLDKPTGPTSHDMVEAVRRLLGARKVGHTGTLDPLASGLLVVLVGRATKLAPFIPGDPKVYEGSILLGLSTDSMDIEGRIISETRYQGGPERARSALVSLEGEMEQLPPMFSAVKYRGRPLYTYARRGEEVPRESRTVQVYKVEMTAFNETGPRAELDFTLYSSPGFYVREFAARMGEVLGCGAVLSRLRRVSSGPFRVEEALTPEELSRKVEEGGVELIPPRRAVDGLKKIVVRDDCLKAARNGTSLEEGMIEAADEGIKEGGAVAAMTHDGELIGVHRVVGVDPFASLPQRIM